MKNLYLLLSLSFAAIYCSTDKNNSDQKSVEGTAPYSEKKERVITVEKSHFIGSLSDLLSNNKYLVKDSLKKCFSVIKIMYGIETYVVNSDGEEKRISLFELNYENEDYPSDVHSSSYYNLDMSTLFLHQCGSDDINRIKENAVKYSLVSKMKFFADKKDYEYTDDPEDDEYNFYDYFDIVPYNDGSERTVGPILGEIELEIIYEGSELDSKHANLTHFCGLVGNTEDSKKKKEFAKLAKESDKTCKIKPVIEDEFIVGVENIEIVPQQ